METITYYTHNLPLMNKKKVIQEIRIQGIEKLIVHVKWTRYLVFAMQDCTGRVVEILKDGDNYKLRDNEDPDHQWSFPKEELVCDFIEKVLRRLIR